jgi:predicted ATPase
MIESIELKAFKSFPHQIINCKPLTLFTGINNSGKSSIIQALRMYCQAGDGESALLKGHGNVNEIRSNSSPKNKAIEVTLGFKDSASGHLELNDRSIEAPTIVPVHCYVGADRLGPQTSLPLPQSLGEYPKMGDKGEYVLDFLQKLGDTIVPEPLIHPEAQGKTLAYVLMGWLNEISPGVEFSYQTNSKADLAHATIDSFRPTNVGFGLSYTLPVLVAILGLASQPPATGWEEDWGAEWEQQKQDNGVLVIIENPEAHLHPQGQTAMGKLIALAASCGIQLMIETHSDHLMDGIRIAVKQNLLAAEQVAFHYLTKNDNGQSEVATPKLHQNGKLDFWPQGFFDQTLKNRAILAKRS